MEIEAHCGWNPCLLSLQIGYYSYPVLFCNLGQKQLSAYRSIFCGEYWSVCTTNSTQICPCPRWPRRADTVERSSCGCSKLPRDRRLISICLNCDCGERRK